MRIGLVVDSACDLPLSYLQQHEVTVLPITVRIGDAVLADHRDEEATLAFLHAHVTERGASAETEPFSVQQIHDLFLRRLVIDYDYVFCLTISRTRSTVHEHALQASFAILNDYKPVRAEAGNTTPFALRVVDSQNLFAAQGVSAVEAIRMRAAGDGAPKIRARLEQLAPFTQGYMIPRDLYYLRNRARTKGDRSVGLLSAALGSALDIKPVLHCQRGETGAVAKIKGFELAAEKLFDFTIKRIRTGLMTPTVCVSYGGDLHELHTLRGYSRLRSVCDASRVELFESVMSLTGMVNVGKGAVVVGFAAEAARFEG